MSLTLLQTRGADSVGAVSSLALAFLLDLSAGSLIVVTAARRSQTGVPTIADSQGNTYVEHPSSPLKSGPSPIYAAGDVSMWWATTSSSGPNTVTLTVGDTIEAVLCVSEYQGHEPANQPSLVVAAQGDSAAPTTGEFAAPVDGGIVSAMVVNSVATITPPGGAVQRYNGTGVMFNTVDQLAASPGVHALVWGLDISIGYGILSVLFRSLMAGGADSLGLGQFNTPPPIETR